MLLNNKVTKYRQELREQTRVYTWKEGMALCELSLSLKKKKFSTRVQIEPHGLTDSDRNSTSNLTGFEEPEDWVQRDQAAKNKKGKPEKKTVERKFWPNLC